MNTVYISFSDTANALVRQAEILQIAPPVRAARISGMGDSGARAQSLAATWALHEALSSALAGYSPPADFSYLPDGRPQVPGIRISIAHTPGMAVCAASDADVGVDIERGDRHLSASLLRRILSPGEVCPDIIDTWTAKEAYLKLTGEGLGGGMAKLAVSDNIVAEIAGHNAASLVRMRYGEYCVAVCCHEPFACVYTG